MFVMSVHYWVAVRSILQQLFEKVPLSIECDRDVLARNLTLRPPKEEAWGDLCSNILLLICADDAATRNRIAPEFISALEGLDDIKGVSLSENGYLNITVNPDYWGQQLFDIIERGASYALADIRPFCLEFTAFWPQKTDNLVGLRQQWNVQTLCQLAEKVGADINEAPWAGDTVQGFSSKSALSKCGETTLKLALLSRTQDFAIDFKPLRAAERCYGNPAFSLLYANARLKALLMRPEDISAPPDEVLLLTPVETAGLNSCLEIALAKLLCQWPLAVRRSLIEGDAMHLISFLQEITLLFFRLYQQVGLQSSDYLVDKEHKKARQLLLTAVKAQLCSGLDILDVDRAEEFI